MVKSGSSLVIVACRSCNPLQSAAAHSRPVSRLAGGKVHWVRYIRADAHVFLPRCMCLYLDIWTTGVRDIGDGILILEFVRYFKHCFVKAVEIFNEERGASAPVCHLLQRIPAMAADGSVRMW